MLESEETYPAMWAPGEAELVVHPINALAFGRFFWVKIPLSG